MALSRMGQNVVLKCCFVFVRLVCHFQIYSSKFCQYYLPFFWYMSISRALAEFSIWERNYWDCSVYNTGNLVLGDIYPVSRLGQILCPWFFLFYKQWHVVARVFQAAVEVTLLLWDQCLLVPVNWLYRSQCTAGDRSHCLLWYWLFDYCCLVAVKATVHVPWKDEACGFTQSLLTGAEAGLWHCAQACQRFGSLDVLKEVSYQWKPRAIVLHGGKSVKFIWEGVWQASRKQEILYGRI